jgi:hypothetical protein
VKTSSYDAMVAEATVDCYGEDEQLSGLLAMVEEHLVVQQPKQLPVVRPHFARSVSAVL